MKHAYEVPPERSSHTGASYLGPSQDLEVDCLRQCVLVLDITLSFGSGSGAIANTGNRGDLAQLGNHLDRLGREVANSMRGPSAGPSCSIWRRPST